MQMKYLNMRYLHFLLLANQNKYANEVLNMRIINNNSTHG